MLQMFNAYSEMSIMVGTLAGTRLVLRLLHPSTIVLWSHRLDLCERGYSTLDLCLSNSSKCCTHVVGIAPIFMGSAHHVFMQASTNSAMPTSIQPGQLLCPQLCCGCLTPLWSPWCSPASSTGWLAWLLKLAGMCLVRHA